MYDFDKVVDRRGTSSIKWNFQNSFGQQSGLLPFWIADTDFATVPEIQEALKKRCDHGGSCGGRHRVAVCSWIRALYRWRILFNDVRDTPDGGIHGGLCFHAGAYCQRCIWDHMVSRPHHSGGCGRGDIGTCQYSAYRH